MHIYTTTNESSNAAGTSLPILTPIDYQTNINTINEEQMLMAAEDILSEKSDCESSLEPMKINTKQSLPHKKRIAKKLNADQFPIILTSDIRVNSVSLFSFFK
jgi:hypothetical protein